MPFDKFLEYGYRYGSPLLFACALMFAFYKVGMRILDSYERREASYGNIINTGMASITLALQELSRTHQIHLQMFERISKDLKDGFDRQYENSKYLREEHKEVVGLIAQGQKDAMEARERIMGKLSDQECKAK